MQFKRLFSPIQLDVIRIYPDNPIIYHQQIPSLKKNQSLLPPVFYLAGVKFCHFLFDSGS